MIPVGAVVDCEVCDGRGVVQALHLDQPIHVREIETCPACAGTGAHLVKELRA